MPAGSISIGRLFGVNVELHWTFVMLLLFVMLVSLYDFLIVILLFAFVLVHELVHCLMAKREKVKVSRIVLYPFGGGSIINPNDLSPRTEFSISLSGPIASLFIALALWLVSILIRGPAEQFVYALALINLILGAFNLLPWLPLDGGRALRSYLQRSDGIVKATKKAVKWSNITTIIFLVLTTLYALTNSSYSPSYKALFILFDTVIALFIYSGAQGEMVYVLVGEAIKNLKVRDAATNDYLLAKPDTTISQLKSKWKRGKKHYIVLFQTKGEVNALSSFRVQRSANSPNLPIKRFGFKIPTIGCEEKLANSINSMNENNTSILAVMKGNKLAGVLQRQRLDYIVSLHMSQNGKILNRSSKL